MKNKTLLIIILSIFTVLSCFAKKKIDENSGQWTFSTAAYYPISNYLGQVFPDCKKWYPFHYSQLKLYYTWIDGNN